MRFRMRLKRTVLLDWLILMKMLEFNLALEPIRQEDGDYAFIALSWEHCLR